jgi:hypothetical protein
MDVPLEWPKNDELWCERISSDTWHISSLAEKKQGVIYFFTTLVSARK